MMIALEAITDGTTVTDICACIDGRRIALLGRGGKAREEGIVASFLKNTQKNALPVLLGSGMGHALQLLLAHYEGPLALVDKEKHICALTKTLDAIPEAARARLLLVTDEDPNQALKELTLWQGAHGNRKFCPLIHPFYQRLDPAYYATIRKSLEASASFDFWGKVRAPRFVDTQTRVLLLTSKYFLMGELVRACEALGLAATLVTINNDEIGQEAFVEQILQTVLTFRPDCCITLNHMGIDREGVLMDLLARLELPLASWFVDNPHLIIHLYTQCVSPWTALFTWDADNIASLRDLGFPHVSYLPLGTDPRRFHPNAGTPRPEWRSQISFVGNSMLYKVGGRLKKAQLPTSLRLSFQEVSHAFIASNERSVRTFLKAAYPALFAAYEALEDTEAKLAYETAVTWQATREYRKRCVRHILPFHPTLVGDAGWQIELAKDPVQPRYLPELNYYAELPIFYTCQDITFNCTSQQMKGAVNQRVFDCPAAGGFVLTDWRAQIDDLFSPKEMVCYKEPEEIEDLVRFYLAHPNVRRQYAKRARARVLRCHTWEHRVATLLHTMRDCYGSKKP